MTITREFAGSILGSMVLVALAALTPGLFSYLSVVSTSW